MSEYMIVSEFSKYVIKYEHLWKINFNCVCTNDRTFFLKVSLNLIEIPACYMHKKCGISSNFKRNVYIVMKIWAFLTQIFSNIVQGLFIISFITIYHFDLFMKQFD